MTTVEVTKRCPKCGMVKPAAAFSPNPRCAHRLQSYCKPCHNECNRTYAIRYKMSPTNFCKFCETEKPHSEFYSDLRRKTALSNRCKSCMAKHVAKWRRTSSGVEHRKAEGRRYWAKGTNRQRGYFNALLRKYGITREQFDEMMISQCGRCAGCEETFAKELKAVHVDHCHVNGWVRGLLCNRCNQILGLASDDPKKLYGLAAYLFRETV